MRVEHTGIKQIELVAQNEAEVDFLDFVKGKTVKISKSGSMRIDGKITHLELEFGKSEPPSGQLQHLIRAGEILQHEAGVLEWLSKQAGRRIKAHEELERAAGLKNELPDHNILEFKPAAAGSSSSSLVQDIRHLVEFHLQTSDLSTEELAEQILAQIKTFSNWSKAA